MAYFDPTSRAHLDLLPVEFRDSDEVARIAEFAEADIIDFYTRAPRPSPYRPFVQGRASGAFVPISGSSFRGSKELTGTPFRVYLRGYEENSESVDQTMYPKFVEDMRATIVLVTEWRMQQDARPVDAISESDGRGKIISLRRDRLEPFPPRWNRRLRKYELTEQTWAL